MSVLSKKTIADAIARVPRQSTKDVRMVLERAQTLEIQELVDACRHELSRRPFPFSSADIADFDRMESEVEGMTLSDATRHAFSKVRPPNADEVKILRWLGDNPGGSFQDAMRHYAKGDLSLVIGHLVYDRYGCFRRFFEEGEDQSSVLLQKDRTSNSVRYTLRPEVEEALRDLAII